MLDSGKRNPNCEFSEGVVTYLYDELEESKKTEFENHLGECKSCPDELAAFASLSGAVRNWRDAEFANIATPSIEIPFERKPVSVSNDRDSNSWLEGLRRIFGLSPTVLKAAAAFGTLAILLGLGWFLNSSLIIENSNIAKAPKDVSDSAVRNKQNVEVPKEKDIAGNEDASLGVLEPDKMEVNEIDDNLMRKSANASAKRTAAKATIKSPRVARKSAKPNSVKAPKPLEFEEPPRLTDEVAVEDRDELRLTDIFSEVGNDR